jgi:hypothetical protein
MPRHVQNLLVWAAQCVQELERYAFAHNQPEVVETLFGLRQKLEREWTNCKIKKSKKSVSCNGLFTRNKLNHMLGANALNTIKNIFCTFKISLRLVCNVQCMGVGFKRLLSSSSSSFIVTGFLSSLVLLPLCQW